MEVEIRVNIINRCCFCLYYFPNLKNLHKKHAEMFSTHLNLIITWDSGIAPKICSNCVDFLQEAKSFREKVISSQSWLLDIHNNTACSRNSAVTNDKCKESEINNGVDREVNVKETTSFYDDGHRSEDNISPDVSDNEIEVKEDKEDTEIPELEGNAEPSRPVRKAKLNRNNITKYDSNSESESDSEMGKVLQKRITEIEIDEKETNENCENHVNTGKKKKKPQEDPDYKIEHKKNKEDRKLKTSVRIRNRAKNLVLIDKRNIQANMKLLLMHTTVLPFKENIRCFYCDELCVQHKELKQHNDTVHNDISETSIVQILKGRAFVIADISCLKCKICKEEFKTVDGIMDHLSTIHNIAFQKTNQKPSHGILEVDISGDRLKCHICKKEFNYYKKLPGHMDDHYGTYICDVCGNRFLTKSRYEYHYNAKHSQDVEKKCKHCGLICANTMKLTAHVNRVHRKPTILTCLKCPMTFSSRNKTRMERLNHMYEVHGIKKPIHKCDVCGKVYGSHSGLSYHKLSHTREKEETCQICSYVTLYPEYMKKHMNMHRGVKPFECVICKKKLATHMSVRVHMKTHLRDI